MHCIKDSRQIEEAHNLLKNTAGSSSELVSKSVEMLTNTIAEVRTYGEGFIIVDQSPSSVDIAAIKNTNTKIVLRTPEVNDRKAVGRSMGLTEEQVNEIAKLPSGVAVVYQNDWINPVLTMVDKALIGEREYENKNVSLIKPLKEARTEIVSALMQPWLKKRRISGKDLQSALKAVDLEKSVKNQVYKYIDDYVFLGGKLIWNIHEIPILQKIIRSILAISDSDFEKIISSEPADTLRSAIRGKTLDMSEEDIEEICNVLTKVEDNNDNNSYGKF